MSEIITSYTNGILPFVFVGKQWAAEMTYLLVISVPAHLKEMFLSKF